MLSRPHSPSLLPLPVEKTNQSGGKSSGGSVRVALIGPARVCGRLRVAEPADHKVGEVGPRGNFRKERALGTACDRTRRKCRCDAKRTQWS